MQILIVESDPDVARSTAELLRAMGHDPEVVSDAEAARRSVPQADAVLLDRHVAGADLRALARDLAQDAPVVLFTTAPDARELTPSQPFVAVVEKPFRVADLEQALDTARASASAFREDASSSQMASG